MYNAYKTTGGRSYADLTENFNKKTFEVVISSDYQPTTPKPVLMGAMAPLIRMPSPHFGVAMLSTIYLVDAYSKNVKFRFQNIGDLPVIIDIIELYMDKIGTRVMAMDLDSPDIPESALSDLKYTKSVLNDTAVFLDWLKDTWALIEHRRKCELERARPPEPKDQRSPFQIMLDGGNKL